MGAGQDREPDHVNAFVQRGGGDFLRRQSDAFVNHVKAAIAGAHGDLFGTVGMAVESWLADQEFGAAAELIGEHLHFFADLIDSTAIP